MDLLIGVIDPLIRVTLMDLLMRVMDLLPSVMGVGILKIEPEMGGHEPPRAHTLGK